MSENNLCAIVIPIYKEILNEYEICSLQQCVSVLKKYPIYLVTYNELSTVTYKGIFLSYNVSVNFEYFDKEYFKDLSGYNNLMMKKEFYDRFTNYKNILIYQLDCFVFRDDLESWCNRGYDYIGAPWFDDNLSHEEGANLWAVGNGGFSLRKISAFRNLFVTSKNLFGLKQLSKKMKLNHKGFLWVLKAWIFGYENNFQFLLSEWTDAEDLFYCLRLSETKLKLKVPELKDAIDFAFEQSPGYLFELNNNTLPFGCHAWNRYETNSFWREYILIKS
jgi:hypothetical protein